MGVKLTRQKPKNPLVSFVYRLSKVLPMSSKGKMKLFLDLEWIFDRLAHETSFHLYADEQHPVRTYSRDFILKRIEPQQNVLDLGCKYGEIGNFIAAKARKVVGIDFDEKAISIAKQKYQRENLSFEVGEASAYLDSHDEKFDVLILSHILEHLDDPKSFLVKFKNYFRFIYIEVPDFDKTYLNHYRKDQGSKLAYTDDDHISEFDRYELQNLLQHCGLNIIEAEYIFGVQKIWCEVIK